MTIKTSIKSSLKKSYVRPSIYFNHKINYIYFIYCHNEEVDRKKTHQN